MAFKLNLMKFKKDLCKIVEFTNNIFSIDNSHLKSQNYFKANNISSIYKGLAQIFIIKIMLM